MNHNLKVDILLAKSVNYQSDNKRDLVDVVQQAFQQSFVHLKALEMCV